MAGQCLRNMWAYIDFSSLLCYNSGIEEARGFLCYTGISKEKDMKKKFIISSVVSVFIICIISIFAIHGKQETKYKRHFTFTGTTRVGGFIPNVQSNEIVDVPEEYVLSLYGSDITYEELVSELGEPSGTVGSGIVRDYWRIGKDKYAVCSNSISTPFLHFEIWTGTETAFDLAHQKNA